MRRTTEEQSTAIFSPVSQTNRNNEQKVNSMSDNTPTERIELNEDDIINHSPFKNAIDVVRNGIAQTLKVFVGKRGAWENRPYAAFQLEADPNKDFDNDETYLGGIKWIGKDNIVKMLNVILRRIGQDNTEDSVSVDGVFSLDAFKKAWETLTAAGLKISELKELLDAEQKKHQDYIANIAMTIFMNGTQDEKLDAKAEIEKRTSSINALRFELEARQQRRSKEVNTEEVRAS